MPLPSCICVSGKPPFERLDDIFCVLAERDIVFTGDMLLSFQTGSEGDILTTNRLVDATVGEPGSWAYAYGTPMLHTELGAATGPEWEFPAVSIGGNTYDGSESGLGIKFDMQEAIDGAINIDDVATGNPTEITTGSPHGRSTGDRVTIRGVTGNTPSLNSTWEITVTGADTFTIATETTVAGSGGEVLDAYEGAAWTAPADVERFAFSALMQFNMLGSTEFQCNVDHRNFTAGGFRVIQQQITSGEVAGDPNAAGVILAHGQAEGGGSANGPATRIEPNVVYRVCAFSEGDTFSILFVNNATGALVLFSEVSGLIVGDLGDTLFQDYLTFNGGYTLSKGDSFFFNDNAQFPPWPFTCPPVTALSAEQTDVDEVTVEWTSRARNFLIERSDDGGASWITLETNFTVAFHDVETPWEYEDITAEDQETYRYRVAAKIKSHVSTRVVSGSVTVDNGGQETTPDEVAGLVLWLRADAGVESSSGVPAVNNDPVEFWRDSSFNADDASQANMSERPIFRTNIINGLPVVRFSSDDVLAATIGTTAGTIFAVVGNVTHTNANAVAGTSISAATKRIVTFFPNATTIYSGDSGELFGNTFSTWVDGVATNTFPGSGAFGAVTERAAVPVVHDGVVGVGRSSVNDPWVGDIAEFIIYSGLLSVSDRTAIEAYLMNKYNLP